MKKLQIAIIGCGKHPRDFHIPSLNRLNSKFNILGVYDKNFKRAKLIKNKFKIKRIYKRIDDLVKDKDLDLVDICSPATKHYEHILKSINKKIKYILVEKPFVTKIKNFNYLLTRNSKNNCNLICLGQQRYREETKSLKKFLFKNRKELGSLIKLKQKHLYV